MKKRRDPSKYTSHYSNICVCLNPMEIFAPITQQQQECQQKNTYYYVPFVNWFGSIFLFVFNKFCIANNIIRDDAHRFPIDILKYYTFNNIQCILYVLVLWIVCTRIWIPKILINALNMFGINLNVIYGISWNRCHRLETRGSSETI